MAITRCSYYALSKSAKFANALRVCRDVDESYSVRVYRCMGVCTQYIFSCGKSTVMTYILNLLSKRGFDEEGAVVEVLIYILSHTNHPDTRLPCC